MSQSVAMSVFEIVGSPPCVASDDGQKVHDRIAGALSQNRSVSLSFLNVTSLTSAFLNAAIGQLYGDFSEDRIRQNLTVTDMVPDDIDLLKRVVETAKAYFKDPDRFNEVMRSAMEEEDDE